MHSVNAPVPGAVRRLAADLAPRLAAFESVRERPTLVVKRLPDDSPARLHERLRDPLAGTPGFEARVTGVDYFERPASGRAPVVYLAVESPGIRALHDRLVAAFGAVDGLEGEDYVPHVTLARGGPVAAAEALADADIDPVTWTVSELLLWSRRYREPVATLGLPR